MYFADSSPDIGGILNGYGLAGVVIFALAAACAYLYKENRRIQEARISDAKEFGNKISEPLESLQIMTRRQAETSEKMYDLLLDGKRGN